MNRFAGALVVAGLLLPLAPSAAATGQTPSASRPNILLMFPDNLGWA